MDSLVQIDFQHGSERLTYQHIPWDSKYLHNTTVQVLSTEPEIPTKELLSRFCAQFVPTDLLFAKIAPTMQKKIHWFEQNGFYVVEHSVEPHLDLSQWKWTQPLDTRFHTRPIHSTEVALVSELSAQAFSGVSRYFLDPHILNTSAAERYADWVKTSLTNQEDVQVLVDEQDQVVGFFINHYKGSVADNRLIALAPAWRGQGLGKELYVRMVEQAKTSGATQLISRLSTQNQIAMKFYEEFGVDFQHPLIVLHRVI